MRAKAYLKSFYHSIVFASLSSEFGFYDQFWIFRSYDNFPPPGQKEDDSDRPLNQGRGTKFAAWKVARAATAAKLYFKPLEIALDDDEIIRKATTQLSPVSTNSPSRQHGATEAKNRERKTVFLSDAGFSRVNNPSTQVLEELSSIFRDGPKKIANWVSIGTARRTSPYDTSTLSSVLRKAVAQLGDPEVQHEQMRRLQPREFSYHRLNEPDGLPDIEMDDWMPRKSPKSGVETMKLMRAAFNHWVAEPANQASVQQAARSLVDIRRARTAEFSRWERFALGRCFICPANNCPFSSDHTWDYRDSFIQHLRTEHGYNEGQVTEAIKNCHRDWKYKLQETRS